MRPSSFHTGYPELTCSLGTTKVEPYLCKTLILPDERRVWLVDTPGFDDSTRSDTDVLRDIAAFLSETYRERILLTGIIYLHRISDNRLGGSGLRQMQMFRKLCGEQSMGNIALATTMWSTVNIDDGQRREDELIMQDGFWKRVLEQGASIFRQDRGKESAEEIVGFLVERKHRVVFDIQTEMVDNNKRLDETAAGQEVQAELAKQRERYEKELRSVKAEMQEALMMKDSELTQELQSVKDEVERKLEQEREAARRLQASRDDLYRQMEEQRNQDRQMWQQMLDSERAQRTQERNELKTQVSTMQSELSTLQQSRQQTSAKTPSKKRTFERECCSCNEIDHFDLKPGTWCKLRRCSECLHKCRDCCRIRLSVSNATKYYYGGTLDNFEYMVKV